MKIKGITITLIDKVEKGIDAFGSPIFEDKEIEVKNVLVARPTSDEMINSLNLYGKKIEYILGIPKGDMNDWEDKEVRFFNKTFRTIGFIEEGIEELVPLFWHKKIRVIRYA